MRRARIRDVGTATLISLTLVLFASSVPTPSIQSSSATEIRANRTLSSGVGHLCAIGADGMLRCWGINQSGQLGDGSTSAKSTLTIIGAETDWLSVSAGDQFTCGIREVVGGRGSLWCWGLNSFGQLGIGNTDSKYSPTQVGSSEDWVSISTGLDHTCGIKAAGELYCWGRNQKGQVGSTATPDADILQPTRVASATVWSRVEAGFRSTIAVDRGGHLWTWGFNDVGQLGDSTTTDRFLPVQIGTDADWAEPMASRFNPWPVGSWDATSPFSQCAIKVDESLWCAGYNYWGSFGNGSWAPSLITFSRAGGSVGNLGTYSSASISGQYGCGVRSDVGFEGTLWCWGEDNSESIVAFPALGYAENGSDSPLQIGSMNDWVVTVVGPSYNSQNDYLGASACALNEAGAVYCWGSNLVGQQARGFGPRDIGGEWSSVAAGRGFSCGIHVDGTAACWGSASGSRSLGINESNQYAKVSMPVSIEDSDVATWSAIALGDNQACGIALSGADAPSGSAWCWGAERAGALGNYPRDDCGDPLSNSNYGNLGSYCGSYGYPGVFETKRIPVRVGDESCDGDPGCNYNFVWTQLAVGGFTTCGITSSRSLWCWGEGANGELGDNRSGTDMERQWYPDNPTYEREVNHRQIALFQVGSADGASPESDWIDIALASGAIGTKKATCGIREFSPSAGAGTLWCWGGSAGVGGGSLVPVQVGTDNDWRKIALGEQHACALKSDQTLWCWGVDAYGALGLGEGVSIAYVPTQVGDASDWIDIGAGASMSCGIRTDGALSFENTLYCWGDNSSSLIGRSSTESGSSAPVAIVSDLNPEQVSMSFWHACVSGSGAVGCHGEASQYALGAPMLRELTQSVMQIPTGAITDFTPPTAAWSAESTGASSDLTALSWTLTFDEAVTGLSGSDFENAATFTSTGCEFSVATADADAGLIFTVTVTSCSDGTIRPSLKSDAVLDAASNAGPDAAIDGSTTVTYAAPGGGGEGDGVAGDTPAACSNSGILPLIGSDMPDLIPASPGASGNVSMQPIGSRKRPYGNIIEQRLDQDVRRVHVGESCATEIITSKGRLQFSNASYVGSDAARAYIWTKGTGWRNLARSSSTISPFVTLPVINFQAIGHYVIAITNGSGKAGSDAMWGTRSALISVWITTPTFRVSFAPDSPRLTTKAKNTLKALMNEIATIPGAVGVEVTGYINPYLRFSGTEGNIPLTLAKTRAERVKRYLIKLGLQIPLESLPAQRGEDKRMVPNRKAVISIRWNSGT